MSTKMFKKKAWGGSTASRAQASASASKAKRGALTSLQRKQVKKLITAKEELKFFDTAAGYTQIDRTGRLTILSNVPQGVAQFNRVGDELEMKYIEVRLNAYYNSLVINTDVEHKLRVILFRWRDDTSVHYPVIGDIVETGGASVGCTVSPYTWATKHQKDFTVLYDKTFSMSHDQGAIIGQKFDLYNQKVVFDRGAATGAGNMFLLEMSDDASGAHTPDVQSQWFTRLVFTDS